MGFLSSLGYIGSGVNKGFSDALDNAKKLKEMQDYLELQQKAKEWGAEKPDVMKGGFTSGQVQGMQGASGNVALDDPNRVTPQYDSNGDQTNATGTPQFDANGKYIDGSADDSAPTGSYMDATKGFVDKKGNTVAGMAPAPDQYSFAGKTQATPFTQDQINQANLGRIAQLKVSQGDAEGGLRLQGLQQGVQKGALDLKGAQRAETAADAQQKVMDDAKATWEDLNSSDPNIARRALTKISQYHGDTDLGGEGTFSNVQANPDGTTSIIMSNPKAQQSQVINFDQIKQTPEGQAQLKAAFNDYVHHQMGATSPQAFMQNEELGLKKQTVGAEVAKAAAATSEADTKKAAADDEIKSGLRGSQARYYDAHGKAVIITANATAARDNALASSAKGLTPQTLYDDKGNPAIGIPTVKKDGTTSFQVFQTPQGYSFAPKGGKAAPNEFEKKGADSFWAEFSALGPNPKPSEISSLGKKYASNPAVQDFLKDPKLAALKASFASTPVPSDGLASATTPDTFVPTPGLKGPVGGMTIRASDPWMRVKQGGTYKYQNAATGETISTDEYNSRLQ